ncbi:biotin transporter BioY [Halobacillus sp. Cin3]|uniref:biotin transporter BioY n=1 Tax=Halobacillus sp. Cin3 TaxID=2928441 RepID=UPI00248D56CE|nr:biotin transporter BioY [Halobacillus sp. Cin3]
MSHESRKLRFLLNSAIFAALTAIMAQVEIPLPVVPISGQTLAVGLTATILGSRQGAAAMVGYMALGAVGMPVFAGFSGGPQVLAGPTGGYIFGFILSAFITGYILEKTSFNLGWALAANTAGMVITLLCGILQLKFVLDISWTAALATGAYPFIAVGLIKAFLASWLGITVRKRLVAGQFIKQSAPKEAS